MATQDRSPSLIIGQQWSALGDFLSSDTENDEDEPDKDENKKSSNSMKLQRRDMGLFGFCPSRDEFNLVVCETCGLLVKPQALRLHIESRHGPLNLSSLGNISVSALNSELGKKLLIALPFKAVPPPHAPSSAKQTSRTVKPLPTKASLKHVPASVRNISAPILGVRMKISPMESVKSRNRIVPAKSDPSAVSSPVVKMEKLGELSSALSSSLSLSSKLDTKQGDTTASVAGISKQILNLDSSKISTLMNGSIKSVVSLSTPSSAPATTCPSMVSTPALIAATKTSTDTPPSTRNVTTFVSTSLGTKPLKIAPVLTVGSTSAMTLCPVSSTKNTKVPKDQKERKFLPCKDREYDADKHCGVMMSETSKQCTRSLTCKTHALSLRRAVSGRSKSFDDLLKEHKATKEAILRAKAESQNAAAVASAAASASCILVSPAAVSATMNSLKHEMTSVIVQQDGKVGSSAGLSGISRTSVLPSSVVPTAAAHFVKPANIFQRFTSSAILPSAITVKEMSGTVPESPLSSSSSSTDISRSISQDSKLDQNFIPYHPKPFACNQFAGRVSDRSCFLFSRKMDYVRAALLSALERQHNPPPHKKLCVESNLPKESPVLNSSQDPYNFNIVDTNGVATFSISPSLVSSSKPSIKPKTKLPASPVASSANPHTLNLPSATAAASLSFSASSLTSLYATPATVSSVSPSELGLSGPVKYWENVASRSPLATTPPAISSVPVTNPGKRKRSGSSGGSSSQQLVAITSSNGASPVSPTVTVPMTLGEAASGTSQQTSLPSAVTPANLHRHQSGSLIAIPGVTLTNANLGQLSGVSLGTAKITASSSGASLGTAKITASSSGASLGAAHKNNNIFKDFNLLLTGIDPSLVSGQYVNITGAQLTELTAGQGQTLFLNNFTPCGTNSSAASGTASGAGSSGSVLLASKPAERSRGSGSKTHPGLVSSAVKISPGALEGFKLIPSGGVIPSGCLPPTAVLMDSGSLQGAVLTLAAGGSSPALVAVTPATSNAGSTGTPGNPAQDLPTVLSSPPPLVNGVAQTSHDKPGSTSQRHRHSSSSKSHHHHHHHHHHQQQHHSKTQHQQGIALGGVLQTSPSVAVPLPSGTAAQLCSSQAIFKSGGAFSLTTKSSGGKLTMQPVSLTFPISMSQAGLATLNSGKTQQLQQQQQSHHTVLVAAGGGVGPDLDPTTLLVAGKADLLLQPHLSNTSASNVIS